MTLFSIFENYKNPFKYLFIGLIILYIALYFPYGLEDGDMGAIFGISWSMYLGQFPYRDFVYIKPPFSPFVHSLPLYISEEYAYLFNRALYYIQVFTYSLLLAKLLCQAFSVQRKDIAYFIGIVGALISIHNYPPMPWNTIDGVFFSVMGLWFLFSKRATLVRILLAALFVSLGVLCKQSFYFFPVFISLYLAFTKQFKTLGYFIGFGLLFAGAFLGVLYLNDALEPFFTQMFSFTSGSRLLSTGLKSYYLAVKFHIVWVLLIIPSLLLLKRFVPANLFYLIIQGVIITCFLFLYALSDQTTTVKQSLILVWFVISFVFSKWKSLKNKNYYFLTLVLSLGWCASISNGFNTPIDVSTGMVFATYAFVFYDRKLALPFKKITGIVTIIAFVALFYRGYQNVYMDSPRSELTYTMGTIFPQLSGIKSDAATYNKYAEMKTLAEQYPSGTYTFLPSMTLGHYLTKSYNPIGIDWLFNHHIADQLPQYISKLEANNIVVFLENDFETSINNYEKESLLSLHVRDHWELIETLDYFRVYKKRP